MKHNWNEGFQHLPLDKVIADRFGRYSKYVIQDRALPDVRDGLKPVQRRILFSMHELGLRADKAYKKSARVVGEVIGKYHPHGDTSIYDALTRMSQAWKINMPLVKMHGNNGSVDDDPAAAMRYTEVRLEPITSHLLNGIEKETVLFAPNFDDSEKEPTVLPALLPNLLVNGARGIAAGYATEIPPHNLAEVINALVVKIKNPNVNLKTLLRYIVGPDFPTGGMIQGNTGISEAFEHGRGKIAIRSKYEIVKQKHKQAIVVTEIPYGIAKAKLVREIDEIRFHSKVSGISDVRDESDRKGINIRIELEPDVDAIAIVNYLLAKTELQIYYNYNIVAIKNKTPQQMGLIALLDAYLEHQTFVLKRALTFELNKAKKRLEIVVGLIRVVVLANEMIALIRTTSGGITNVVRALQNRFQFTELQAQAIAKLRLYRLSHTNQMDYKQEQEALQTTIYKTEAILNSSENFNTYLVNLLENLKNEYGTKRKTKIKKAIEPVIFNMEALIKHEQVWIGVTRQGYIKRFSNRVYEANAFGEYKIRPHDILEYFQFINTSYKLLVFTTQGNYAFIPVHKIVETRFKDVGNHINDFVVLNEGESIIGAVAVQDFDTNGYIILVTARGKGKRILINNFKVSRYAKMLKAFRLDEGDELRAITISNGFKNIIVITKSGRAGKYRESEIKERSTKASGFKTISLADGDEVASIASATNDDVLGIVSNRGGMKRIRVETIQKMSTKSQGIPFFRAIKNKPHFIIDSRVVTPQTEVVFSKDKLEKHKFSKVEITTQESGLSLVSSESDGALINNYQTFASNDSYFEKTSNDTEEERFDKAEQAIESVTKIPIGDLLKSIK